MKQDNIYIVVISIAFFVLTCIFNFLPRSTYSALEKRDLKQFPAYSLEDVKSGDFTKNINSWFSDSEPYRDFFMQVSMKQKDLLGITKIMLLLPQGRLRIIQWMRVEIMEER